MPRDFLVLIHDVAQACVRLTTFTADKTEDDYLSDNFLRSAVERQFTIVGEALARAVQLDAALLDRVSQCSRIIRFRHVLVHGYAIVSDETVWSVIQHDLPILHAEVRAILEEPGEP